MMRSMFTAITGLNTHQNKMDVIANNIANVNTIAFKSARVTFSDVFYQTSQGGSGANAATGRGGTNPMQVGLGVGLSSIDNQMTQGAAMNTGNELDLMINGKSFFIVGDSSGMFFTRAGAFRLDNEQNIVTSTGYKLYGWNSVFNPTSGQYEIQKGAVEPLNVLGGEHLTAMGLSTTLAHIEGNLSAKDCVVNASTGLGEPPITQNLTFYDSLGNAYTIDVEFTLINPSQLPAADPLIGPCSSDHNNWLVSYANTAYCNGTAIPISLDSIVLQFDTSGNIAGHTPLGTTVTNAPGSTDKYIPINFAGAASGDPGGPTTFIQEVLAKTGLVVDFDNPIDPTTGQPYATPISGFVLDFTDITATTGKTSVKLLYDNGHAGGELTDWSIGSNGIVTGVYSNGDVRILGQVAVANFQNPAGLEKVGDNMYQTTANSGEFNGIGDEVTYGGGSFIPGSLEMSNVDLSTEFTEMITTQRGFQANSRIITTSDELLQELVNLKR